MITNTQLMCFVVTVCFLQTNSRLQLIKHIFYIYILTVFIDLSVDAFFFDFPHFLLCTAHLITEKITSQLVVGKYKINLWIFMKNFKVQPTLSLNVSTVLAKWKTDRFINHQNMLVLYHWSCLEWYGHPVLWHNYWQTINQKSWSTFDR